MFIMISVATLCAMLLIAGLLRVACQHRGDLWIVSHDVILCFVAPVLILLGTFGAISIGYRLTHGGLGEVSTGGWIGTVVIVAAAFGLWHLLATRIRESGRKRAMGAR